jgi:quinoprotein glucose dehydrogenase
MKKPVLAVSLLLSVAVAAMPGAAAPGTPGVGDWSAYGHDEGGVRFSPLTQITPDNVSGLKPAWVYHMNPAHGQPADPTKPLPWSEQTPLVIKGVMYLGTPYGRVVALDADTGKEIWVYELPAGNLPATRGLAYWPGTGSQPAQIMVGTQLSGKLIALNAKTGKPVEGFADHGILDLKTPDVLNGFPALGTSYDMVAPPSIYKNLVILNNRVQEQPVKGASGDVRAFDVRTGKHVWTFHTIPRPGEKGFGTWEGDSWVNRSGTNIWNMLTVDEKRGIAFLPIGAPTIDRYGSDRIGANLFSDTLVAVDANTGKYMWHFQVTHHDIWDYDLHTPPTLLEVKRDGKTIPAVAVMNKMAFLFILNRVTGEPLYEVKEMPVPTATNVPGEQPWPTQPVPVKPPALTRQSFALNEVVTLTKEAHDFCQAWIERDNILPSLPYEPIKADQYMVNIPAAQGGPEWAGGAFDPKRGIYVVNTNDMGYVIRMVKRPDGAYGPQSRHFAVDTANSMLCQQPPWGDLTAINVNTGDIVWRQNFGVTESLPAGQQNTGRPNTGGPILTASGLIFIGATDDRRFRAYDTMTGKELWTYTLDYAGHATPITYRGKGGRQYVAITATGGTTIGSKAGGDSVMVFALP